MMASFRSWWTRPPARQRILATLDKVYWRQGMDVKQEAKVWAIQFVPLVLSLEVGGLIESKEDDQISIPPWRQGYARRLYRLK